MRMGLGSRPGHRRACRRRPIGGALAAPYLYPYPSGYYPGYYAAPPYGGPRAAGVWTGYAGCAPACDGTSFRP